MPEVPQVTPEVTWAQRSSDSDPERNYLYVSLKTPDVPKSASELTITPTNVTFTGESKKGVKYHVSLDLYGEIDPENSKVNHTDREVELVLRKKELKEEYWPRLVKTTQRLHFLKTDFDKWVDEDEQDEAVDDDYANNFGGFDGLDQGGLGNIDFSKLGAGLGGAEGFGGAEGAEGAEEEDEEMPELEGEVKTPKIQEVS
ncbi:Hsp90 cochaperone SBA1 [Aspergillus clavatus NRRL 1]|uniref:Hsp90 binding co-chaperone (Sba1), putative n=1 Tax=Aspergillus clavatus (strain ATCC 1007 / CBS 513.65 / DSM 816 / NCTC 3887 / NRRL 1 / QM 1276 / 107) TaxID=344612 RepID=A1CBX8_ASPCL|nr:Hsp90 binding co-chaperone (Sba1), putative [Aspergillus clavatus NRRL 1]EAW13246.1 Hsp90 binding co-chaperone (Sba1), putative [Aspergillus clavatus NRRL 1]